MLLMVIIIISININYIYTYANNNYTSIIFDFDIKLNNNKCITNDDHLFGGEKKKKKYLNRYFCILNDTVIRVILTTRLLIKITICEISFMK